MTWHYKVNEADRYTTSLLYTSNGDGTISFDVEGSDATGRLKINSTSARAGSHVKCKKNQETVPVTV